MCVRSVLAQIGGLGVTRLGVTRLGVAGLGVAGLALAAGPVLVAGPAVASSSLSVVGTSPAARVIARAPLAVSVTFDHAPDPRGASMRIYGPTGEVSAAQPEVEGNGVRRVLDPSIPGGAYTVTWSARQKDGGQVSGSFTFTAAAGTGTYANSPAPAPDVQPSGSGGREHPSGERQPGRGDPNVVVSQPVSNTAASRDATSVRSTSLSAPLLAVPVAVGILLALASAGIGAISRLRRRAAQARPGRELGDSTRADGGPDGDLSAEPTGEYADARGRSLAR